MTCPTPEQLAALSLGLVDKPRVVEHVKSCSDCARVLAAQSAAVDQLSVIHREMGNRHSDTRIQLLERLPVTMDRRPPSLWRRWAIGGLAVAAMLLLSFVALSPSRLSAMERIESALREVRSFSYRLTNDSEFPASGDKPARTLQGTTFTFWRAPPATTPDQFGDLRAAQSNEWVYHHATGDEKPKITLDLIEIHPSGRPGILIDFVARKFFRVPPLHAGDIASSTPLLWLRAVREKSGRITDELGTRDVAGRAARGYRMTFDNDAPFKNFGPVDVWIDPQTDLPVELSFEYANPDPGFADRYTVRDLQWNAQLDPKLFDTTPPAGFTDVTVPTDEQSIAEIIDALKLHAELSGGRYPHVEQLDDRSFATRFDAAACYRQMLELAGYTDSVGETSVGNQLHQRIEKSRAGLDTLERILQSYKWLIGYDQSVTAQDNDKVLLWWNVAVNSQGDQYRIFYGDLRTEVVPGAKWSELVTPAL